MLKNKLTPLALKNVKIKDDFWSRYVGLVHNAIIPYQWEIMNDKVEGAEPSHCIKNFKIAAGLEEGEFYGMVFQDTDLAKWLEAVAYSLEIQPNEKLEEIISFFSGYKVFNGKLIDPKLYSEFVEYIYDGFTDEDIENNPDEVNEYGVERIKELEEMQKKYSFDPLYRFQREKEK